MANISRNKMEDKLAMEVIEHLTSPVKSLKIVSVWGMPGLGKTRLASSVYNHASMNLLFHVRAWCYASQAYKMEDLLSEILSQIGGNGNPSQSQPPSGRDPAEEVYKSLKGRKYLIVIDDVWDENLWDRLKFIIPDDHKGSRILLTTRHHAVARQGNSILYTLRQLSDEESYHLLVSKVFDVGEARSREMLAILERVARACQGLPLVIVLLAGILKTIDRKKNSWKLVSEAVTDLYRKHGKRSDVVHLTRVLSWSYNHLPDHLKPCFLYFGALPKVSTLHASMLIRLWIAEGFIVVEKNVNVGLEERGKEYLNELVDRSLVIVDRTSSLSGVKTCRIHDVLRDYCSRTLEKRNSLSREDRFGGVLYLRGNLAREIHSCLYQYRSDRAPLARPKKTSHREELTLGTALPPITRTRKPSNAGNSPSYSVPSSLIPPKLPPVIRKSKSTRNVSSKTPFHVPSSLTPLPELPPLEHVGKSSLIRPPKIAGKVPSQPSTSIGKVPQGEARPRGTVATRTQALHTSQVNTPPRRLKYSYLLIYRKLGVLDLGNARFESAAISSDFVIIATMLVDLTYLAVRLRVNEIPSQISNLQKLQTLVLKGVIGTVFFPESFGKLLSLRHLLTDHGLFTFEHCSQRFFIDFPRMVNMKSISNLFLRSSGSNVEKYMLRMLPGLQKLGCRLLSTTKISN